VELTEWIRSYAKAWETADEDLIAALFTEDASYRSSPISRAVPGS
jgi:hypothetical protein